MFKRFFDIFFASLGLLILLPIIIIIAWQVNQRLGSPIFFRQVRPGLKGCPFTMIKFRTMRDTLDANGNVMSDAERLTAFGKFLRASSLDELPELLNVVKGEMSLVGPRPLLMEYMPLYNQEQRRRHDVKPGITGWAQVNGRNAISWDEKFNLDSWYVDNQSFWLDVKILFLTLKKVIVREGISSANHATVEKFTGNSK